MRIDETNKNKQNASETNRRAEGRNDRIFFHAYFDSIGLLGPRLP